MRNEKDGNITRFNKMLDTTLAFLLEEYIADRERLIDNQNIWLSDSRDCKGNASNHTRREILQRHINKISKLGKLNYAVKIGINELFCIA